MTLSGNNSSRRTFLKAAAVAGTLGVISTSGQAQATTIELGGDTGGWIGRSPESIAETRNPTLELEPGQTYEIVWENVDGARHNVVILSEGGERLVRSELIAQEGATQTVEFEATAEMSEYLCEAHPETMIGGIETAGEDAGQEATETPTEEETETEDGTDEGQDGEETEVPEAREPQEAVEATPEADPEVPEQEFDPDEIDVQEFDPDEIDVKVFINGTEVGNESEQESRWRPSSSQTDFGTLGAFGGLASVGAYLFSRDEGDE
jgi:plastocyanin